jgi:hypothetical protein
VLSCAATHAWMPCIVRLERATARTGQSVWPLACRCQKTVSCKPRCKRFVNRGLFWEERYVPPPMGDLMVRSKPRRKNKSLLKVGIKGFRLLTQRSSIAIGWA